MVVVDSAERPDDTYWVRCLSGVAVRVKPADTFPALFAAVFVPASAPLRSWVDLEIVCPDWSG